MDHLDAIKNLQSLYTSQAGADLKIQCEEHVYPVHRIFVQQQEGYFKAMLEGDRFVESKQDTIDLSKIGYSSEIIEAVLKHIYGFSLEYPGCHDESPETANPPTFFAYCFAAGVYFQIPGFQNIARKEYHAYSGLDSRLDDFAVYEIEAELGSSHEDGDWSEGIWDAYLERAREVLSSAPIVYSTTPDGVNGLRQILLRLLSMLYKELVIDNAEIRTLLEQVPGFSVDLNMQIKSTKRAIIKTHRWWYCSRCEIEFLMSVDPGDKAATSRTFTCPKCSRRTEIFREHQEVTHHLLANSEKFG